MADASTTGTSEMLAATFNFAVEVDGIEIAFFREASGLSMEVEVIEHQVVNKSGQQITQKLAGHRQMGEITLKKSMDGGKLWTDWLKEVQSGSWKTYRRNGSIKMYDTSGETVGLAFHLMNAFDLPPGSIGTSAKGGGEGGGVDGFETTEWTAVSDLKNLRYYIKTYDNSDVRMIDLGKTDLNAEAIKMIDLDQKQVVKDLTP